MPPIEAEPFGFANKKVTAASGSHRARQKKPPSRKGTAVRVEGILWGAQRFENWKRLRAPG